MESISRLLGEVFTPALLGYMFGSAFTLLATWIIDSIKSKKQFERDKGKIVFQHRIEVMEQAVSGYKNTWDTLNGLKKAMEKFSTEPTLAQLEMLQMAIENNNQLMKMSFNNVNVIHLYYDLSDIDKQYDVEHIHDILSQLNDIISKAYVKMSQLQKQGASQELMIVEAEHVANAYHLYAQALECKMNSLAASINLLRKELNNLK